MSEAVTKFVGSWSGSFNGTGNIESGGLKTQVSLPREFGGTANSPTPEDLLLAAIGACYLITLGIMLDKANLTYQRLSLEANLSTSIERFPTIQEIELRPIITVEQNNPQILDLMMRAKEACVISRAIDKNIKRTLMPTINTLTLAPPTNYDGAETSL